MREAGPSLWDPPAAETVMAMTCSESIAPPSALPENHGDVRPSMTRSEIGRWAGSIGIFYALNPPRTWCPARGRGGSSCGIGRGRGDPLRYRRERIPEDVGERPLTASACAGAVKGEREYRTSELKKARFVVATTAPFNHHRPK